MEYERHRTRWQTAAADLPETVCPDREAEELPPPGEFEIAALGADTLATIVYTSGTTGRPKGVMLSHANILANVAASLQVVDLRPDDGLLSVLPLSHMFERTCGYYLPLAAGIRVAYARGIQQIGEDSARHRPTVLIAVPRVFERFQARLDKSLAEASAKRALFRLAVHLGWRVFKGQASLPERLLCRLLRPVVARPVLARLGGRLRLAVAGGAKLELRIAHTFLGLGLNLIQGYGLTEASPVVAANGEEDNDPETVGRPLRGLEVRIDGQGELLLRGPSVMLGYWEDREATSRVIDADGWLNTGDLAQFRDGRIAILGRSKDILVLSNGEKASPQDIEAAILDDPIFEQVLLVGEGRPFFSLLAVTAERDGKALARRANARLQHFPRYQRVRQVIPLSEPWTVESGLLTPTLKVKRDAVLARFAEPIERTYRG